VSTETLVDKQVRLVLEQQCAEVFGFVLSLLRTFATGADLTFLAFDSPGPGNIAFKTTLPRELFLATLDGAVERWRTGVGVVDPSVVLVGGPELERLGRRAARLLPPGVTFAIFVGRGPTSAYLASAEREGMAELITELVRWERAGARGAS
jgi:hypothetical protein